MKNPYAVKVLRSFLVASLIFGGLSSINIERLHAAGEVSVAKVNINKASADELQAIRGVGPSIAARIVAFRDENGHFESLDDLAQVRGVGGAKLQKIKDQISV